MFQRRINPMAVAVKANTIKFHCSYGGKILPRQRDGKLRYVGGSSRIITVYRFTSFAELMVKLEEWCGFSASLNYQLPTEDLDALVSVTSDEDLACLIEEYDLANMRLAKAAAVTASSSPLNVRAFLSPNPVKKVSPPLSAKFSIDSSAAASKLSYAPPADEPRASLPGFVAHPSVNHASTAVGIPVWFEKSILKLRPAQLSPIQRPARPTPDEIFISLPSTLSLDGQELAEIWVKKADDQFSEESTGNLRYYAYPAGGTPRQSPYLVHNRNHWQ